MYSNIKHVRVHIYIYIWLFMYIYKYIWIWLCIYIYMYDYIYIYLHTTYMSQVPGTPQPAQWYGAPPPKPPICTLFKHSLPFIHYLQHFRATTSWVTGPCPAVYFQHINLDLAITGILPKTCLCTAYSMPYTWLYSQRAHIDTYVILLSIGLDAVCTYKSPPKMTYPCVVYTLPHHYLYTP